jgi:hypothetical protein
LIKANRFHIGKVIAELQEDKVLIDLWTEAISQSLGIDNIILAKYLKLRAEMLAEEDGSLRKT